MTPVSESREGRFPRKIDDIPQAMQHRARPLHHDKNGNGQEKPHVECDDHHDHAQDAGLFERVPERGVSQGIRI